MKHLIFKTLLLVVMGFAASTVKSQTFDLTIINNSGCTGMTVEIIGTGGTIGTYSAAAGTTTCISYPAGQPPVFVKFWQGTTCTFSVGVSSGCCWSCSGPACGCSCLNTTRTFASSWNPASGGTSCPLTPGGLLTLTIN